jgi:hypothetical protein
MSDVTLEEFKALRELQDHRVLMTFADGQQIIATLHNVTTDFDASRHLIYDKVEWSALPHAQDNSVAYYAKGEELVSCVVA